jgi:DNA-binding XRE family transcriptional regulator
MKQKERFQKKAAIKIREVRKSKELSQTEVGKIVGLSQASISKLENCDVHPGAYEWNRFCQIFGVNPVTLENTR